MIFKCRQVAVKEKVFVRLFDDKIWVQVFS